MTEQFQERWYQEESVEALINFYMQPRKVVNGVPEKKNAVICLPGGTGKSVVIAKFIKKCFEFDPHTRVMMSTHVKELISQNCNKLQQYWPSAPVGICSAGMGSYDKIQPIIFGGIQTMVGKFLGKHFDFLVIDEAHLVGTDGSYLQLINELTMTNPYLKIILLTASPYRMGMGLLTNGPIATDIVYNLCNIDGFSRLIAEGYLCRLIVPARLAVAIDISRISFNKEDFIKGEVEKEVIRQNIYMPMLSQYLAYSQDRRCGLIFAAGITDAHNIQDIMQDTFKIECAILHSKMGNKHNDEMMKAWKAGEIKHAVNMNMLTTGVDNPMLDICCDGQPTMSTPKHVQKYSRFTRPFENKLNGLILDYAGNTRRLGPINDPVIPRLKGEGPPGDAPVRICPQCGVYNHARAVECVACGCKFDTAPLLSQNASTVDVMKSDLPDVEVFKVQNVFYSLHKSKASGRESIKIIYQCGLRSFYDWKNVEGQNYNGKLGRDWFRQVYGEPFEGMTNKDVLTMISRLRAPSQIRVWLNANPNPKVLNQEF